MTQRIVIEEFVATAASLGLLNDVYRHGTGVVSINLNEPETIENMRFILGFMSMASLEYISGKDFECDEKLKREAEYVAFKRVGEGLLFGDT